MSSRHLGRWLSLVLVMSVGIPASSATSSPSCRLIVDPVRDDDYYGPAVTAGSMDLTSADVAGDSRFLTGVLRLRDLTDRTGAPSGARYDFVFTMHGQRFIMSAFQSPDGVVFELRILRESAGDENHGAAVYGIIGKIDGIFDEDTSEIRMHVPAAMIRKYGGTRGSRLEKLSANSQTYVGTTTDPVGILRRGYNGMSMGGNGPGGGDSASTTNTYAIGQPSCVKPGV